MTAPQFNSSQVTYPFARDTRVTDTLTCLCLRRSAELRRYSSALGRDGLSSLSGLGSGELDTSSRSVSVCSRISGVGGEFAHRLCANDRTTLALRPELGLGLRLGPA